MAHAGTRLAEGNAKGSFDLGQETKSLVRTRRFRDLRKPTCVYMPLVTVALLPSPERAERALEPIRELAVEQPEANEEHDTNDEEMPQGRHSQKCDDER